MLRESEAFTQSKDPYSSDDLDRSRREFLNLDSIIIL